MLDKRRKVLLKDLTVSKVKRAYKKTHLTPRRGSFGCAIDAIAKARGLKGWYNLTVYENENKLWAFIHGFDGQPTWPNVKYSRYYDQGKLVAEELIDNG